MGLPGVSGSRVIVVVSLLGSLGQYTSPIWVARVLAVRSKSAMLERLLPDLGPIDPVDATPIRQDGYLRDGDGSFYWWLTQALARAFASFGSRRSFSRSPLWVWPILAGRRAGTVSCRGRARGALTLFFLLLVLTSAALAGVVL